jgi:hypothetical protein
MLTRIDRVLVAMKFPTSMSPLKIFVRNKRLFVVDEPHAKLHSRMKPVLFNSSISNLEYC